MENDSIMDEAATDSKDSKSLADGPDRQDTRLGTPAGTDILMGIHLNVSIRFGQGQLPLRQILELGPDSVAELEQGAEDPVELLVGGRVIARGEVVTTGENYGLRISEIVGPERNHVGWRIPHQETSQP